MRNYLVVDDNVPFAENLAEILEAQGAHVIVVSAGKDALKEVALQRFDAVISDMKMPTMGGAELIQSIHEIDPGVPVIVITAHSSAQELNDLKHQGIFALLPKPVPIQQMNSLLLAARRHVAVPEFEDVGPARSRNP